MTYPTLGHDPAPGHPASVRRVAAAMGAVAEDAESVTARLRRIGAGSGDAVWRGPAADAFQRLLAEVGPDVVRLAGAHREAQDALVYYAGELERAQDVARRAESDAARATAERDGAAGRRRQARDEAAAQDRQVWECRRLVAQSQATRLVWAADPAYQAQLLAYEDRTRGIQHRAEAEAAQARGREQAARSAETAAATRLKAALLLGAQAREVRDAAAARVVTRLDAAGPLGESLRERIARGFAAVGDFTRRVATSDDLAWWLDYLDGAGAALTVIGTAAMFIPGGQLIGGVFLTAATVLGAVSLAGTVLARFYGAASNADVAWGIVGLVPGLKMAKKLEGSASGLRRLSGEAGKIKRLLSYDDPRRATGILRDGIPVAPKLRGLRFLPKPGGDIARLFYAGRMGIDAHNQRNALLDTVHNVHGIGRTLVRPVPRSAPLVATP